MNFDKNVTKTDTDVRRKDELTLWLDNLIALRDTKKLTNKRLAESVGLPERTVTRIFSGETPNPSMDYLIKIVNGLDGSLDDIFENTRAVVGDAGLVSQQAENERLINELNLANAENAVLRERAAALTTENDILRLKLEHKEEIIALHNYYTKFKTE